jgi:hypothetical protein
VICKVLEEGAVLVFLAGHAKVIGCGLAGLALFSFAGSVGADEAISRIIYCVLRLHVLASGILFGGITRVAFLELKL